MSVFTYTPVSVSAQTTSSIITLNTPVVGPQGNPLVTSSPVPIAFWVSLLATISAGASLTYTIQVTNDKTPSASGNWNDHDTLFSKTGSANGNISAPVTGVRINCTAYSSGTVTLEASRLA